MVSLTLFRCRACYGVPDGPSFRRAEPPVSVLRSPDTAMAHLAGGPSHVASLMCGSWNHLVEWLAAAAELWLDNRSTL